MVRGGNNHASPTGALPFVFTGGESADGFGGEGVGRVGVTAEE